jgi:predicted aminopeptidase
MIRQKMWETTKGREGGYSAVLRMGIMGIILILVSLSSGCRLTYLFQAAEGQFRLLYDSVPIEEALEKDILTPEQKDRLRLVSRIKDFGERQLGLKQTQNYQTVYLNASKPPIYMVLASPKDRLSLITWWFPVVGDMPYLGFFDPKHAAAEKATLAKRDLDVIVSMADAYSTLGWFDDPVTRNLVEGSTVDLVETILHEMTHTTLYLKGQGAFNEGLAVLVGKEGALRFLEKTYGVHHPLTTQAEKSIEDERLFSSFLARLLDELEGLYRSPVSYQEKLRRREAIFERSLRDFTYLSGRFQTRRFNGFGNAAMNNAYLMSVGLYHRHFQLFEAVLDQQGNSIRQTLAFLRNFTKGKEDVIRELQHLVSQQHPSRGMRAAGTSFNGAMRFQPRSARPRNSPQ